MVLEVILRSARVGLWVAAGLASNELVDRRRARTERDEHALRELRDPDPRVRAAAADRLGRSTRVTARPALEAALRDPDSAVRIAVASALCELGDPAAVPALRDALADEADAGVRAVLVASLERLGESA